MFSFTKDATVGVIFDTDLSNGIPAGLRPGDGAVVQGQFSVYADQEANPGGAPDIYPFYKTIATSTGSLTQYEFNGTSLVNAQSGTDATLILPDQEYGGGGRSWNADDVVIEFTSHTTIGPNPRFGFIIHNPNPTAGNHTFRLWYSLEGETPNQLAALTNPSGGVIVGAGGNDALTQLDAEVEYFVTWDTVAEGIPEGARARISAGVVF
jgi:hypothetical protein